MAFTVIYPFLGMQNLKEICREVYQTPGTHPATRCILAYGTMYHIFLEYAALPFAGVDEHALRKYALLCKTNMEVAISHLDLLVPASYENIMALALGAAYATEMCKPSLCWVMVSLAAGLCQSLGYHRYQTMKDDSEEERTSKIQIFWMIYMFDKTLSLRLGRACFIQDWDISLPFVMPADKHPRAAGRNAMLTYWVNTARVQGLAYEKLFSPAAFSRSSEDRAQTAAELIHAMDQAWYERGEATIMDFSTVLPAGSKSATHIPNDTEIPSKRRQNAQQPFGASPKSSEHVQCERTRLFDSPP